ASHTTVIYIAHSTLSLPAGIDTVIPARRKDLPTLQREIQAAAAPHAKTLLVLPTLHPLLTPHLPTLLAAVLTPHTSLLALFHTDVPTPAPPPAAPYAPTPLPLLRYLATTVLTTHSLAHVLARRRAAARSRAAPAFGRDEEVSGVLVALGANDARGTVLEMEYRRKSGRGVGEWFFLPAGGEVGGTGGRGIAEGGVSAAGGQKGKAAGAPLLLEDHPLWRVGEEEQWEGAPEEEGQGLGRGTFSLGLTEKQRRDREGVVLPYLDAQREGGGVGGRILYDMGVEDDFDEEEDEI
ncbi:hypothetical protein MMC18_008678, partial [Xylographa bjoerkii]|nr:hypothetical protein [Xylographa bjoerkii]